MQAAVITGVISGWLEHSDSRGSHLQIVAVRGDNTIHVADRSEANILSHRRNPRLTPNQTLNPSQDKRQLHHVRLSDLPRLRSLAPVSIEERSDQTMDDDPEDHLEPARCAPLQISGPALQLFGVSANLTTIKEDEHPDQPSHLLAQMNVGRLSTRKRAYLRSASSRRHGPPGHCL
jgi:hypothetical protein